MLLILLTSIVVVPAQLLLMRMIQMHGIHLLSLGRNTEETPVTPGALPAHGGNGLQTIETPAVNWVAFDWLRRRRLWSYNRRLFGVNQFSTWGKRDVVKAIYSQYLPTPMQEKEG